MKRSKFFLSKLSVFVFLTALSFGGHAGQEDVEDASEDTPKSSHKSGLNVRSFKDASFKFENDPFKKVASETNKEYAFRLRLNDFLEYLAPTRNCDVFKRKKPSQGETQEKIDPTQTPAALGKLKKEEVITFDWILETALEENKKTLGVGQIHDALEDWMIQKQLLLPKLYATAFEQNVLWFADHLDGSTLFTLLRSNHQLYRWGRAALYERVSKGIDFHFRQACEQAIFENKERIHFVYTNNNPSYQKISYYLSFFGKTLPRILLSYRWEDWRSTRRWRHSMHEWFYLWNPEKRLVQKDEYRLSYFARRLQSGDSEWNASYTWTLRHEVQKFSTYHLNKQECRRHPYFIDWFSVKSS